MAGLEPTEFEPSAVPDDSLLLFPVEKREQPASRPAERVVFHTVWAELPVVVHTEHTPARRRIDWRRLSAEVREKVALRSRSSVLLTSIALGSAVVTAGGIRYFYAERPMDVPVPFAVPTEAPPLLVSRVVMPLATAARVAPPAIPGKPEPVVGTPGAASRRSDASARPSPRTPAYRGHLIIDSTPRGATVFINQRQMGVTPLELPRHPSGSYAVWVQRDGFQRWTAGVLVPADRITRVTAKLERRR
jgi:hypothetical protein